MTTQELQEQREIQKELENAVKFGTALQELRKDKNFKEVIETTYLDKGLDILWDNMRKLTEAELQNRGGERNQELLGLIEKQIAARLTLRAFFDTIMNDANNAAEELQFAREQEAKDGE